MPGTGTLRRSSKPDRKKAMVGKSRVEATRLQRLSFVFLALALIGCFTFFRVSVTPSATVRVGGNLVREFHDICSGGGWTNFKTGLTGPRADVAGGPRSVVSGV